jgi:hypothetical protein
MRPQAAIVAPAGGPARALPHRPWGAAGGARAASGLDAPTLAVGLPRDTLAQSPPHARTLSLSTSVRARTALPRTAQPAPDQPFCLSLCV